MKRDLVVLLLLGGLAGEARAQASSYDIATFTVPAGWQRTDQNGFAQLQGPPGRPGYAWIFLFASHPATTNPQQNFAAEWARLVAQQFGAAQVPQVQSRQSPDGWTAVSGGTRVMQRGSPVDVVLFTASGFGTVMSVVLTGSGSSYSADVQGFMSQLRFHAPATGVAAAPPSAAPGPPVAASGASGIATASAPPGARSTGAGGAVSYVLPQGWTGTQYPDGGIVYGSAMQTNGERCQISVFPLHAASGTLADEARRAFTNIFQSDPLQDNAYPYPTATLYRGKAAQGWEYYAIRRSIHGRVGDYGTLLGVEVMAAQVGNQVAIITHTGKDAEVSMCFGEVVKDEWPRFFASIQFATALAPTPSVNQQLAGQWILATGSVGLHYTFAPNGRYSSVGAAMTTTRLNSTEVLETTNGYNFGDGGYTIAGNVITLTRDSDHRAQRNWFRLEQVSKDGGATWTDRLCLLAEDNGEVCYRRDR